MSKLIYAADDEENIKTKNKEILGFVLENNEVIIVRMDTLNTIYRFNQANSDLDIEGVYHISGQKALIFYLSNDTIKIASYATQTCDRYITNLDKIYDLLRVDENLGIYFDINKKTNNLINNNSRDDLEFDEIDYEKFLNKKNNNNINIKKEKFKTPPKSREKSRENTKRIKEKDLKLNKSQKKVKIQRRNSKLSIKNEKTNTIREDIQKKSNSPILPKRTINLDPIKLKHKKKFFNFYNK